MILSSVSDIVKALKVGVEQSSRCLLEHDKSCNEAVSNLYTGLSGSELRSPKSKNGAVLICVSSANFSEINISEFTLASAPIWSKWVLSTQSFLPSYRLSNNANVQILFSAASHPIDGTSGVGESQKVPLCNNL